MISRINILQLINKKKSPKKVQIGPTALLVTKMNFYVYMNSQALKYIIPPAQTTTREIIFALKLNPVDNR